jgi:hypothetical protein
MSKPILSLILCSRNDQYMGNSLWRLQTTLNYVAQNVHEIGREEDIEVLVADWGSEVPLRDVLILSPATARIVSFILIPPEIARDLQKDSPFAEVLALNAAARRASGKFIGRIDQDTLVGRHFLEYFFGIYEGSQNLEIPLASALLFSNQRMVPYRFAVRCPSFWAVDKYIGLFRRFLKIEITSLLPFFIHGVGIWLVHSDLWKECGGYDERMIYMNGMEVNMIARLMMKYKLVNLGKLVDYDFYHLEHYPPLVPRRSSTFRKVNPIPYFTKPGMFNPNGSNWGLAQYAFEKLPCLLDKKPAGKDIYCQPPLKWLSFFAMVTSTLVQITWDKLIELFSEVKATWRRRAQVIRDEVRGQPLHIWPRHLASLWIKRNREQRKVRNGTLEAKYHS